MEDLIIATEAPVEHEGVYPGKNMRSLLGQICSGRASKLAGQWTRLSRPAVPQRPRFSLCVSSSLASRPYKACFAWVQTPSSAMRKSLCCFRKYNIKSNMNSIIWILVGQNQNNLNFHIDTKKNEKQYRTNRFLQFGL